MDNIGSADDIAAAMAAVSGDATSWTAIARQPHGRQRENYLAQVCSRLRVSCTPQTRLTLTTYIRNNTDGLMDAFVARTAPPDRILRPVHTSTPTRSQLQLCDACGFPLNNAEMDIRQCDDCHRNYHLNCVERVTRVPRLPRYVCPRCRPRRRNNPEIPSIVLPPIINPVPVLLDSPCPSDVPLSSTADVTGSNASSNLSYNFSHVSSHEHNSYLSNSGFSTSFGAVSNDETSSNSYRCSGSPNSFRSDGEDGGNSAGSFHAQRETSTIVIGNQGSVHEESEAGERFQPDRRQQRYWQAPTLPREFKIRISAAEYPAFFNATTLKMHPGHTNLLRAKIRDVNPYCTLEIATGGSKLMRYRTGFCKMYKKMYCKQGCDRREPCLCYTLSSDRFSTTPAEVEITVRQQGEWRHRRGSFHSNRLSYGLRQDAANLLQHRRAAQLSTAFAARVDRNVALMGNTTGLDWSGNVFRQTRYEAQSAGNMAKDDFEDLQKFIEDRQKQPNCFIRGHELGRLPRSLWVAYATQAQIDAYIALRRTGKRLIAHIDSSGSMVRRLDRKRDVVINNGQRTKEMLVYALTVASPQKGRPPLALFEWITNNNTAEQVTLCLGRFNTVFRAALPQSTRQLFQRVEMDFSRALMHGVCMTFNHCDLRRYLDSAWNCMIQQQDFPFTLLHVCRAHSANTLSRQLKKHFPMLLRDRQRKFLMRVFTVLLKSSVMASIVRRVQLLLVLLLCPKEVPEVVQWRQEIFEPTPPDFAEENQQRWIDHRLPNNVDTTYHRGTLFGSFFHALYDQVVTFVMELEDNIVGYAALLNNPLHNVQLATYLRQHFFPYVPILTRLMFDLANDDGEMDYNWPSEQWWKIHKHHRYPPGTLPLKISRFLRYQEEQVPGKCTEYIMDCERVSADQADQFSSDGSEQRQRRRTAARKEARRNNTEDYMDWCARQEREEQMRTPSPVDPKAQRKAAYRAAKLQKLQDSLEPEIPTHLQRELWGSRGTQIPRPRCGPETTPSRHNKRTRNASARSEQTRGIVVPPPHVPDLLTLLTSDLNAPRLAQLLHRVLLPVTLPQDMRDAPFIDWGTLVQVLHGYYLTNTCTIDNFLTFLMLHYSFDTDFRTFARNQTNLSWRVIVLIIHAIISKESQVARVLLLVYFRRIPETAFEDVNVHFDLAGSEEVAFGRILQELGISFQQTGVFLHAAPFHDHPSLTFTLATYVGTTVTDILRATSEETGIRHNCDDQLGRAGCTWRVSHAFANDQVPPFLPFFLAHDEEHRNSIPITNEVIPEILDFLGQQWKLIYFSTHMPAGTVDGTGHYTSCYSFRNAWQQYDGLSRMYDEERTSNAILSTAFYVPI